MIKFGGPATESNRPLLAIGLTRENCQRMLAGEALFFDTTSFPNMPAIDVFIIAGETEEAIAFKMLKQGAKFTKLEGDAPTTERKPS